MNKIFFAAALLSFFASCKKSYQCDCSTYDSQGNYVSTRSNSYKEKKRETAQAACTAKSNATQAESVNCIIIN